MKIYLVRHGKTKLNKLRLVQGSIDSILSEEGIKQTKQIKKIIENLNIKYVYTGTLKRQKKTADILLEDIKIDSRYELNNFDEANFGSNENVSIEETFKKINETFKLNLSGFNDKSPLLICDCLKKIDTSNKAEDGKMIASRFKKGLKQVITNSDGNVLIVSSGMAIGCLIESLCPDFKEYSVLNCSIHALELIDDRYQVSSVFKGIE